MSEDIQLPTVDEINDGFQASSDDNPYAHQPLSNEALRVDLDALVRELERVKAILRNYGHAGI